MARLSRYTAKIFGSSSGTNQIEKFGSFAGGTTVYTTNPGTIQTLGAWLTGWFGGVVGSNFPAIESMNAVNYVESYQIAYLMSLGVAEWDSGTTYYNGAIVQDGSGNLYRSLTDSNLNNALTVVADWALLGSTTRTVTTTDNFGATDNLIRAAGSTAYTITLPVSATTPFGQRYKLKNVSTNGSIITLKGNGSETIDGLSTRLLYSSPVLESIEVSNNLLGWDII
jgi:hypothetical protein